MKTHGDIRVFERAAAEEQAKRVVLAVGHSSRLNLVVGFDLNGGQDYCDDNAGAEGGPGSPADRHRREHIAYALANLGGEVLSIIVTRKPSTSKVEIESREVGPAWCVTQFDRKAGSFRLERITFANLRHP